MLHFRADGQLRFASFTKTDVRNLFPNSKYMKPMEIEYVQSQNRCTMERPFDVAFVFSPDDKREQPTELRRRLLCVPYPLFENCLPRKTEFALVLIGPNNDEDPGIMFDSARRAYVKGSIRVQTPEQVYERYFVPMLRAYTVCHMFNVVYTASMVKAAGGFPISIIDTVSGKTVVQSARCTDPDATSRLPWHEGTDTTGAHVSMRRNCFECGLPLSDDLRKKTSPFVCKGCTKIAWCGQTCHARGNVQHQDMCCRYTGGTSGITTTATMKTANACGTCGKHGTVAAPLRFCARCRVVFYCNANCQRLHWSTHKAECGKQS
eukprot:TRINITY_DN22925_c0_g1_i1.p1 TRINITY_DN22925_c0_g1~~TRINITY_DN22925_c0_g1_i1.p1  ORF type:complete len:320 (-),score=2.48 TRINITY_DN22925_c0_g1_i1:141-1100(-)